MEQEIPIGKKQRFFTKKIAELIIWAFDKGYEITLSEAYRDLKLAKYYESVGKGIALSLHTMRLAIDLNLFKNGKYLSRSEDYKEIGEKWEEMAEDGMTTCWGGRFADGNHFSVSHMGRK